jgi:TPR repeat protein
MAQNDLGDCHYNGDGVEEDSAQAFRLYTAAAAQGFVEAQLNLGDCFYYGEGVEQDFPEAARYYRKAAEAGWARGQDNLGDCYFEGAGVEQDYPQAIGWYRKAAEQGLPSAQFNLGWCYDRGKGVKKNKAEAAKWYRKAAEQDHDEAQFALGYCYEVGDGVEADLAQAEAWYRKAADQGHRRAKNALNRLRSDTKADAVPEPESEDTQRYWVIAPYSAEDPEMYERVWAFDLANKVISIGWSILGDISSLDEQGLRAAIEATWPDPDTTAQARASYFGMLWRFYHEIKPGDIVIARRGVKMISAVGTVIRQGYYDKDKNSPTLETENPYMHHIDVRWHDSPRDKAFDAVAFGLQTVSQISAEKFRKLVGPSTALEAEGADRT